MEFSSPNRNSSVNYARQIRQRENPGYVLRVKVLQKRRVSPPQLVSSLKYHKDPIAVLLGVNPSTILIRVFKPRLSAKPETSAIARKVVHFFLTSNIEQIRR